MYDNAYNRDVCNAINTITKRMINHENELNNNADHEHKITTRLEGMALRKKNVHGGSGYAAATVGDLGFKEDETHGVKGKIGSGMSAAGVSAAGVSAAGVSAAGRKKRGCGVTGGDLSLLHYGELKGQPQLTFPANRKVTVSTRPDLPITPFNLTSGAKPKRRITRKTAPPPQPKLTTHDDMQAAYASGGAKPATARRPNARNELVRKIMHEKALSLPMASKYVKEHGLYKC